MNLDTKILEEKREIFLPKSAELYIGTCSSCTLPQVETEYFLCYSTFIDVWLKETLGKDKVLRDNTDASNYNKPNLQNFLMALEEQFGISLEKGESYYYSNYLTVKGFD